VSLFRRHDVEAAPPSSEAERAQAARRAGEEELARLRRELAERVASVERKERELADALAKVQTGSASSITAGAPEVLTRPHISLAARSQELDRRAANLAARERALAEKESELASRSEELASTPKEQLAQVDERLAALKEAEQAFARTQAELAARSDERSRREEVIAERERALKGGVSGTGLSRSEIEDLEDRLRRLEQEAQDDRRERTFDDGLRRLEERGHHRTS
jgi:DNA repair exonuclease SbcCD ATPase subunit